MFTKKFLLLIGQENVTYGFLKKNVQLSSMEDFQMHVEQAKEDIKHGFDPNRALVQGKALIAMRAILQEMLNLENLNSFGYEQFLATNIINVSRIVT